MIKCDLQELEDQSIVRYLSELYPRHIHVVELQQYTKFEEVCVLAHRVDQRKKSKPVKKEPPKPFPKN